VKRRKRQKAARENRPLPAGEKTERSRLDDLVARGLLTRTSRKKLAPVDAIRIAGRPLSETIIEDREDRF